MAYTLFISVLSFLAGVFTLRAAERVWKKREDAWKGMSESPTLARTQRYAKKQYRIRVNLGISFLLLSGFWTLLVYCYTQGQYYECAVCLGISFLLILWKLIWGVVDALNSYIFLKMEDSIQTITEEKIRIKKKL